MKSLTNALLLLSVVILLISCDTSTENKNNDNPIPINGEVLDKITSEIGSSGGTINLSDGSSVSINQGTLSKNSKVTAILYSKEQNFSSANHKVIEVNCDEDIAEGMHIKMKVPANLNDNQISLFNYYPNQNSLNFSGILPEFTYDKVNGYIHTNVNTIPKAKDETIQGGGGALSSWAAEWNDNIEPNENSKLIKMPFYEQPGGSCWATCATMLAKSIMPYTDKTKEVEVCNFLQRCGLARDEGIYAAYFLRTLLSAMHYFTGGGFESTGYFRLSTLKEKIISEIDKGHPVLINMDYPGVGAHVIMAVGYTKTANSYKLIYHNPQGTGVETMYTERDIDQLFIKKSMTTAVQILYPKEVPHPDRTLYTIGMPLGAVGNIYFQVPFKSQDYLIKLNEKISNPQGYSWFWNDQEMNIIPDTAKNLEINLPLWNASKGDAFAAKVNIFIIKNDLPTPVYDKMEDITINSGTEATWYKLSIPLSQFVKAGGSKEYRISAKLYNKSFDYLDGFDVKVNIEPQKEKKDEVNTKSLSFTTNEDFGNGVAKFKIEVNYELIGYSAELYSENPDNFAVLPGKLSTINANGKVTIDQLKQKVGDDKDYIEYSFGTPKVLFRSTTNSSYDMTSETRNANPYTGTFYAVEGKNIIIEAAVSIPVIEKRYENGVMTYKSENNISREGKQCWIRAKK